MFTTASEYQMSPSHEALGVFHAIRTHDAVAQTRDGWPYFVLNRIGLDRLGEAVYEIQFGDGEWMLAVAGDLEGKGSERAVVEPPR